MAYIYTQKGSRPLSKISILNPFSIYSLYFIIKAQVSNYIYLYRSLYSQNIGCLLYVFHGEFYMQSYFNRCQYRTLPLILSKIHNFSFLIKQFDHIIEMNVSSQDYFRLCDLLSQEVKSLSYSI